MRYWLASQDCASYTQARCGVCRDPMFRIIPRDTSFFDMFAAMANNLVDAARALVDLFADYRNVDAKIEEIRRIEHLGDEMTHSLMRKLNQTFITPFDREDIHTLASSLDDVVDFI